jgi:hypothetical protein
MPSVIPVEMEVGVDGNAALRAAIEQANAQRGYCTLLIPAGDWQLGQADQPPIFANEVTIAGEGNKTRLHLTGGTYFKWVKVGDFVEGGGLKNLAIYYDLPGQQYPAPRTITDPSPCILISFGAGQQFHDVDYRWGGTFLQCGNADGSCSRCNLDRCDVMMQNMGWPAVRLRNGAGFYWRHSRVFTDTPAPIFASGDPATWATMLSLPGQDMLLVEGPWDTCLLTRLVSMRWHKGINVSPPSTANILCISVDDCIFDFIRENAVYVNLPTTASLNSLIIDGGLHDTWEGDCYSLSGRQLFWPTIRNVRILFCGRSAVKTGADKILGLSVTNSVLTNTSRLGASIPVMSLGPVERAVITNNQMGGKDRYAFGDVTTAITTSVAPVNSLIDANVITTI